jgi:hypothetical protein
MNENLSREKYPHGGLFSGKNRWSRKTEAIPVLVTGIASVFNLMD